MSLVRKELHPSPQKEHEEAELLFLLGTLRHPNIVELLASYTHHGITNLLFVRADFDLHDLLLKQQRPEQFQEDFAFYNAMRGLASGLNHLHNFRPRADPTEIDAKVRMHGYHHDIKPRNILIRGTEFVLADFGLSRLKDIDENTQTPWKDTTIEYGAPECRDPHSFVPGIVGRALDIWSLGCIVSEVSTFMVKGKQGVQNFRDRRVIDGEYGKLRCFHEKGSLSDNVDRYLREITETTSSKSIADIIVLIRKALSDRAVDRPKADEIEGEMSGLAIAALLDSVCDMIDRSIEDDVSEMDQNLFKIRLSLENNRLLAWGDSLGLRPFKDHDKVYDKQVVIFASDFYTILQDALDALSSERDFGSLKDNHDFRLNVLRQANDDLCKNLTEETRSSIDSIFCILTAERSTPKLRRQIATMASTTGQEEHDISAVAAMKYMSLLLERQNQEPANSCRIEEPLMRKESSETFDTSFRPAIWFYSYGHQPGQERKTHVEFMPYWEKQIRDSRSKAFQEAVEAMFKRVQELAAMLKVTPKPPELRVLDCLGSFHDARRRQFALVYELPSEDALPVRLNKLLRHGNSCLIYPEVGDKFALARALVRCIQSIHTSDWIHKSLSSLNIIFFPTTANDWNSVNFSEPFIIGFDHSRKDGKGQYSQGPVLNVGSQEYLHPEYRKRSTSARRSYDYYSLGLILLEIGLWMSISNIYEHKDYQEHSPAALRDKYINLCNQHLGKAMPRIYQEVTKTCLSYGTETEGVRGQLVFQSEVVDKLNMCPF